MVDFIRCNQSVQELLARPDIALIFFMRVSGLPYIFASAPLPADWDEGGGLTDIDGDPDYLWLNSLIVSGMDGVSAKGEPKNGIGVSGSMDFRVLVAGQDNAAQDPILSLLSKNLGRTDELHTVLTSTLSVSGATANVLSTTGFPASGFLYLGQETVSYTGKTGTSFTGLTRGRWGSWAQAHRYSAEYDEAQPVGKYVATWPLAWNGRLVELWIGFGVMHEGVFIPFRDTTGSYSNTYSRIEQKIFMGWLSDVVDSGCEVVFRATSLEQCLANQVLARQPTAQLFRWGETLRRQSFVIDTEWNGFLFWAWQAAVATSTASDIYLCTGEERLYRSGPTQVTTGIYDTADMVNILTETLYRGNNIAAPNGIPGGLNVRAVYLSTLIQSGGTTALGAGKDFRYTITVIVNGDTRGYKLVFFPKVAPRGRYSILQALGYTEVVEAMPVYAGGAANTTRYDFPAANSAPPAIWLPGGAGRISIASRVYLEPGANNGLAFDSTPGWTDDDGTAAVSYVQIDDKIIARVDGSGTQSYNGESIPYLTISSGYSLAESRFARIWPDEDLKIPYDPEDPKGGLIKQIAGFENMTIGRIVSFLLHAGCADGGFPSIGWEDFGPALPSRVSNVAAMDLVGREAGSRRDLLLITGPTEIRKVVAEELKIDQLMLVPSADWSIPNSSPNLTLIDTTPPQESESYVSLTHDHLYSISESGQVMWEVDRQEDNMINACLIKLGFNPSSKVWRAEITQRHVTSIETWGEKDILKIDAPGFGLRTDPALSAQVAAEVGKKVFDRYAFPYEIVTLYVAYPPSWGWQIGQVFSISETTMPNLKGVGRGNTGLLAKLFRKEDRFTEGPWTSKMTLISHASLGERVSDWSPSVLLSSIFTPDTVWNCYEHAFSWTSDPDDLTRFAIGDVVRVYRRGVAGLSLLKTITNIDYPNNRVTFDSNVSGFGTGGDVVMCAYTYNTTSGNAAQKSHVALSNGDGLLDAGVGTARAFAWQE